MIKKVRAPIRVDFAGGTTDLKQFSDKYGGAVLNCGIDKYIRGSLKSTSDEVKLEYSGKIPTSSGLGTSGVMNVVWLALITNEKNKKKLAEMAYDIEQAMGLVGGKQDQYAAALGGINLLEFKKNKVEVTPLKLSKKFIRRFEKNLVLVYTGKPHFSGDSNFDMISSIEKKVDKFKALKKTALQMKKALEKEDLEWFADLMNHETDVRRSLHESIVPPKVDKIIKKAFKNGAIGAKICGSGGGGCVLFLGDRRKLKKVFGKKVIDFKFDWDGLVWS